MHNIDLTTAICTINVKNAVRLVESIRKVNTTVEILIFVDGKKYMDIPVEELTKYNHVMVKIGDKNIGLAKARNFVMKHVETEYIVFLDDDVIVHNDIFTLYKNYFQMGYDLVGGLLELPKDYKKLPKWLPDGFSSLFGIHTVEKKIWGANWGFNVKKAIEQDIMFNENLGRKENHLLSGEETTFINEYNQKINIKSIFVNELAVDHCINPKRYKINYLCRRSYWQGRTEVCRKNCKFGIKKEFNRAFKKYVDKGFWIIPKYFVGTLLFLCCLVGVFTQLIKNLVSKE